MNPNTRAIKQAREDYLRRRPFDPHEKSLMSVDGEGMPAGFLTLPDIGDMQVVAAKLGYEWVALCANDDREESTNEWIETVLDIAGSPELAMIMFANVFRGIDLYLDSIIERAGLTEHVANVAKEAWVKDFNDFKEN